MSVLSDQDRAIVAAAIERATRPKGVLAETRRDGTPPGDTSRLQIRRVSANTFTGLCSYCGAPTLHPVACVAHADLPDLDCRTSAVVTTRTFGAGNHAPAVPGNREGRPGPVTTNTNGPARSPVRANASGASQEQW